MRDVDDIIVEEDVRGSAAEEARQALKSGKRLLTIARARKNYLPFVHLMMPHPEDPEDIEKSRYDEAHFHTLLGEQLEKVERGESLRTIIVMPPGHGKLCADSTPVLTREGWKLHGEIKVDDEVFSPAGKPVKVLAVGEKDQASLLVQFTNGDSVKVHPDHEWKIKDRRCHKWRVLETRQIQKMELTTGVIGKRSSRFMVQLPLIEAIEFKQKELIMPPYALGAWLGDGTSSKPWITHDKKDFKVIDTIESLGYLKSRVYVHKKTGVISSVFAGSKRNVASNFWKHLVSLKVVNNKHIPADYLQSSIDQRLALLAGIIDTDGYVNQKEGKVIISTCSENLRGDIFRLVNELGMRPRIEVVAPVLSSSGIQGKKVVYRVCFSPTLIIPTVLERKKITKIVKQRMFAISGVFTCEKENGNCIQVEGGLYLIGKSLTPTHNSELAAKKYIPWFIGKDPYRHTMFAGYSDTFAEGTGKSVRDCMVSSIYKQVFPLCKLMAGSKSSSFFKTTEGGESFFVGVGGAATGRRGHLIVVDDPIKNREDADSPTFRQKLWEWFNQVVMTRLADFTSRVIIIQTRWHEDDLVGRLTDPENDCYDPEIARQYELFHLPALAERKDALGRPLEEPLWPAKFDFKFLSQARRADARGFAALYQGRPAPEEGNFFKNEWIRYYQEDELPENLTFYAASDHAVSEKQGRDLTCMIPFAVDESSNIYILPDVVWKQMNANEQCESMLAIMERRKPVLWTAEAGHITRSIGPFLYKRMHESGIYCSINELVPVKSKMQRAQSIQGRMAMGKVFFPRNAWWLAAALNEILKFPAAKHDDFVDTLSLCGLTLGSQYGPSVEEDNVDMEPLVGSFEWIKASDELEKASKRYELKDGF